MYIYNQTRYLEYMKQLKCCCISIFEEFLVDNSFYVTEGILF